MAGSMISWVSENQEKPLVSMSVTTITDQWEVQYARFVNYPSPSSLSSSAPLLVPHSAHKLKRGGMWIRATSASLKLVPDGSSKDSILLVSLREKNTEMHRISKLHFIWPQVSCVSGFPARGSRAMIVSYKDSLSQIQKFAMRFTSAYETEQFVNTLKDALEDERPNVLLCTQVRSELSSHSEFDCNSGTSNRGKEDWRNMSSADTNSLQLPLRLCYNQDSSPKKVMPDQEAEEILSTFPPSFTTFLKSCCPPVEQSQPPKSQDLDLKAQIVKYLDDSSFQDMLVKVEKVISTLGDDAIV